MMYLYKRAGLALELMAPHSPVTEADWIDLYRPTPEQAAAVEALGFVVPTLADMEEIEISNRLYREDGYDTMIVVLPGQLPDKEQVIAPVAFLLGEKHLVTVRHHSPRSFETFGARADKTATGCVTVAHVFLGLVEEILGRQADLLEAVGKALDQSARAVFQGDAAQKPAVLEKALTTVGVQGELLSRIRLGLMTMERAMSYYAQALEERPDGKLLRAHAKARMRDLQALEVHADFLSSRLSFATDATLGMVNLSQNVTVRIVSVVAVLFLPPTLIASIYGMNFQVMPELAQSWGYPMALVLMVMSALATYLYFKWKNWL